MNPQGLEPCGSLHGSVRRPIRRYPHSRLRVEPHLLRPPITLRPRRTSAMPTEKTHVGQEFDHAVAIPLVLVGRND